MFERFTGRARRVLVLATTETRLLGHGDITAGHLLLGLAHPESGVTSAIMKESGVTLEAARALVAETAAPAGAPPPARRPSGRRRPRAGHRPACPGHSVPSRRR